jgi:hypothetical protein
MSVHVLKMFPGEITATLQCQALRAPVRIKAL